MVSVIFPAAGQGRRMKAGKNKVLLELLGEPLLLHTLRRFSALPEVGELIVVTGREEMEEVRSLLAGAQGLKPWQLVAGGSERQYSIWNGLKTVSAEADLVLVHDAGNIGDCIAECIRLANEMGEKDPKVWIPQQFSNPNNPLVHKYHTAQEILEQVAGPIHGFCSGVGTGGTLSGIGETLKALNPDITIWAVEPENAAILAGGNVGSHLQMGIGDGLIPDNLDQEIYEEVYVVSDEEALNTAKALAREEGLLCGISAGTNVAAALALAKKLGKGKRVVTVLPDTGERYFSTPLFQ